MTQNDRKPLPVHTGRESEGIAVLTLNRPKRLNALNLEVKRLLESEIHSLDADPDVRAIVITGADGVFVAGTDIDEMQEMSPTDHTQLRTDAMFRALRQCVKPLIAAVERFALGGGCELALACDVVIAGESARFGQPEIRVGIMPGAGGTQILLRTLGKYRAMKYLLTGEHIPAADALTMGMVSEVVETGQALPRALQLARQINAMPPLAVRAIKEVVRLGQDAPLSAALDLERRAFQLLFATHDQREGMQAFLEKRAPVFRGQ